MACGPWETLLWARRGCRAAYSGSTGLRLQREKWRPFVEAMESSHEHLCLLPLSAEGRTLYAPSASMSPVMPAAVTAAPAPGPTMVSGFAS